MMVGVRGECFLEGREGRGFLLLFIYLYLLAVLGLHCCTWAFSNCGKWEQLFIAVLQLLVAWARGFSVCSSQAMEVVLSNCGIPA